MLHRHLSLRHLLTVGAAAAALAGCTPAVDQRGNLPDKLALAQIKPGVTDKATVTRLLGSPSSIAAFDDKTWYYISQRTEEMAFFKPILLDQQVVTIDFDDGGIVRDVGHRDMGDGQKIEPNPNATPAPGREFSIIEQLIGNFGKYNTATDKAESGGATGGPAHP